MAMFAQSLNTLKKRVSEVVKDAVAEGGLVHDLVGKQRREDAGGVALDELGPPSFEADSTFRQLAAPLGGGLPESPILVRYEALSIPDDADPMPVLQPISNGVLAAAAAAAAALGHPSAPLHRGIDARTLLDSLERRASQTANQSMPPQHRPSSSPPPVRPSPSPARQCRFAGGQPAAEPAGRASRRPHGDGIRRTLARAGDGCGARARGDGVGGASTEGALAAETAAGGAGPREAEAGEEERAIQQVRDAAARQQEQLEKDEKLRADKVKSSNDIGTQLDEWAKTPDGQSFKDIKVLISTMHTALWPDSGWKELSLSELLGGPAAVKKWYRKAILVVHPDKQTEAPPDQQVRADRIFQALNEAFKISDDK
eukprot:CAMPEP_0177277516 /NCGR_PEP_ID=MMETSP0367-20130122/68830_1 /TAXON_ID=447022 ORGANISM="Scrippsiella hangoei-like, Strain SHHI-4" /NCGR_SAMPLE_ID=MMETSP0367 /ASSEMBLY_ACC=CAM_ASM_000362 /LENGTH=370 /DNA_ID=CAMNT_0018734099 /DNA_START=130 /DNA_END=1244 /DNA_ORIENTATION=-